MVPFNRVVIGTPPAARTVSASEFLALRPEERVEHLLHGPIVFFAGDEEVPRSQAMGWLRVRPSLAGIQRCAQGVTKVDHRRHSRVVLEAEVRFTGRTGRETFAGVARDISVSGVFVTTSHVLPIGADLVLELTPPCQIEELVLPGVVRWQRPDGMGIEFRALGECERAITRFIVGRGP